MEILPVFHWYFLDNVLVMNLYYIIQIYKERQNTLLALVSVRMDKPFEEVEAVHAAFMSYWTRK